ncbi:LysM repeat-containing protein [Sulfobacillus acidophilus TPY]|uniref:Peptidoglycan-binding lysin domain protein n=1 Tax=Sulfobacillus acidophilus (strain ATCC 700253 / DSM 10332 / NAL) TaxID=679936 RepID=G8TZH3_SULAD|nr:LysM repeat-containing protein [Sulfobacillus acidophilus TPY]AEW05213.1 Peptidoglycan-binding lysin domain protein [Sulfobacillus acidophilus DSM 10332]
MAQHDQNLIYGVIALAVGLVGFELWKNGTLARWFHLGSTAGSGAAAGTPSSSGSGAGSNSGSGAGSSSGGTLSISGAGHYTVQKGDTLSAIAARYGISLAALEAANPQIKDPNLIYPGETITIPGGSSAGSSGYAGGGTGSSVPVSTGSSGTHQFNVSQTKMSYTVRKGDTLSAIAQAHGVSLAALEAANPHITDPNLIYPGETVYIPTSIATSTQTVQTSTGSVVSTVTRRNGLTIPSVHVYRGTASTVTNPSTGQVALDKRTYSPWRSSTSGSAVTVQRGQNLWSIAQAHGLSLSAIERMNPQIKNFNLIYPGEEVHV